MSRTKKNATVTADETIAPVVIAQEQPPTLGDDYISSLLGDVAELEEQAKELAAIEEQAALDAAALQAIEDQAKADEAPASEEEPVLDPVDEVEHVAGDLKEMLKEVTTEDREIMRSYVHDSFDRRLAYETTKNGDNTRMEKNLKGYADKMTRLPLCAVLVATDVDPDFINRSVAEGKRYNVYAIDKVNDLLVALETGRLQNAINIAVTKSLFAFRAAGVPFTGLMATAAASDKVKVENAMQKLLVRHTVSAATAPTQASSTMSALQTLGVVVNRGTQKFPIWQLTDTPQTRALEVLAA